MSANFSQRKLQGIILASKVAEYATWEMLVSCRPCNTIRPLPMDTLPQNATVMAVLIRLRCRTCRGRIEAAALDNQVPGWRSRIVQIWGSGSYG